MKRFRWLLSLSLLIFLAGCGGEPLTAKEAFPSEGRWDYGFIGNGKQRAEPVFSEKRTPTRDGYSVTMTSISPVISTDIVYTSDGVAYKETGIVYFPQTLAPGKSIAIGRTKYRAGKWVEVTVPAGTFRCLEVTTVTVPYSFDDEYAITQCFAPGVGMVQDRSTLGTAVLMSYKTPRH